MKRSEIIDRIGQLDLEIRALEEQRARLIKRLEVAPIGSYQGEDYRATVFEQNFTWLDANKVRGVLGPVKYAKMLATKASKVVRITKLAA